MDRRGSGFKKILGEYQQQPQYTEIMKPVFNSDNDAFFLVLKNLNYNTAATETSGKKQAAKTVENKETVLQFLALNAQADISAIAERLDLSKQRTRAILKEMMADQMIHSEGESRSRVYKLMKKS